MAETESIVTPRTESRRRVWPWLAGLALISSVLSFLALFPMPISIGLIIVAVVVGVLETRSERRPRPRE